MSTTPSAAESARLRLLRAAEERKKARELEDAMIAKEFARIDQEDREERRRVKEAEERRRVKEAEDRQREQEMLEAAKQVQRHHAAIRVKRKAVVLDEEPTAGGSGSSVSIYFRFETI